MASFYGYPWGEPDDSGPELEGTTGGPEPRPWYTRPGTLLLGLWVRALFWLVTAVSLLFGKSERKTP